MARKTKYGPDVVKRVIEAIQMGATYELASGYAGISYQTFNTWMRSKPEFFEAVKRAEGVAAMVWLGRIEKAASEGEWQAAAWKLERRYPDLYGRRLPLPAGEGALTLRIEWTRDWRVGGEVEQVVDVGSAAALTGPEPSEPPEQGE